MKITIKHTAVILASIASLSTTANAAIVAGDLIAIDFGGTVTGTANYNTSNFAATDVADLIRLSDGASTGVSLTVAGATQDNANGIAGNGGNTSDSDIFSDGLISLGNGGASNNVMTITFSGLDDSLTYNLVGGTARATGTNEGNFETDWSVPGATTQHSDATATGGYVSFIGLASSGGSLVITVTDTAQLTPISQIELSAVPEPSSAALLGLGGLALMMRRRK